MWTICTWINTMCFYFLILVATRGLDNHLWATWRLREKQDMLHIPEEGGIKVTKIGWHKGSHIVWLVLQSNVCIEQSSVCPTRKGQGENVLSLTLYSSKMQNNTKHNSLFRCHWLRIGLECTNLLVLLFIFVVLHL